MEEFIGNLIVILIIGIPTAFAYWHLIYNSRQSKNDDIAKKIQEYISFDENTRTLSVYDFHPLIYRVVTMDRYEILHTAYQPETYTYTSVRVGNVTIGDVSKNEAYKYISGSSKTDKYELRYRWKSIYKIELCSQELIDKAKRAGLDKYMNSAGEIIVVGRASVSQEALKSALSGYYAQMQIEGLDAHPSYDKCKRILDFLTSTKGQPVPKEKKDPAQVAALKKTLVGLLVFFLVMGGIFVMLIPSMMEDEILGDLSGTYMELDPAFFDGNRYSLKYKHERSGDEQTLVVNGSKYDVYVKKETWTKVELTGGDLRHLPFSSPLTLKYKWNNGEAVATKLLDSEGNVLWSTLPEDIYNRGIALMEAGQYREAMDVFANLNGYEDSAEKFAECEQAIADRELAALAVLEEQYNDALALLNAEKYDEAASAFRELADFKDSAERAAEAELAAKYVAAESLLAEGKPAEAAIAFGKIALYEDARERSLALWKDIVKHETISVGWYHTVGLCNDGTVVATGDNEDGQCDVGSWTDIVAISTGHLSTVGLRSDGTVVAAGHIAGSDFGEWTDIVAISANAGYIVGLRIDGTVVATGEDIGFGDWTDIVAISAGGGHIVGLRSDGTVVSVGANDEGQCNVGNWKNIVAISAGSAHTVGLRSDGTLVAVGDDYGDMCDVGSWTDIIAVSAGYFSTTALRSDGTVLVTKYGQSDTSKWTDIVAISSDYDLTAGIRSDGTVVAVSDRTNSFGESIANVDGECNVSDWTNIKLPN